MWKRQKKYLPLQKVSEDGWLFVESIVAKNRENLYL